jgi:hypothetical protein
LMNGPAHTSNGARFAAAEGPELKMPVMSETGVANARVIASGPGRSRRSDSFGDSRRKLRTFRS